MKKFTPITWAEGAMRVFVLARAEVENFNHGCLRFEHVLLAVLREKHEGALLLLREFKIDEQLLEFTLKNSLKIGVRKYKPLRTIRWSKKMAAATFKEFEAGGRKPLTAEAILRRILKEPSKSLKRILNSCQLKIGLAGGNRSLQRLGQRAKYTRGKKTQNFSHLVEIDEQNQTLYIYRIFENGKRWYFTSLKLPTKTYAEDPTGYKLFSELLGANLLLDSPSAQKILKLLDPHCPRAPSGAESADLERPGVAPGQSKGFTTTGLCQCPGV